MSREWRLLGPLLQAVAGMLMFGISTAGLFAVVQTLISPWVDDRSNKHGD